MLTFDSAKAKLTNNKLMLQLSNAFHFQCVCNISSGSYLRENRFFFFLTFGASGKCKSSFPKVICSRGMNNQSILASYLSALNRIQDNGFDRVVQCTRAATRMDLGYSSSLALEWKAQPSKHHQLHPREAAPHRQPGSGVGKVSRGFSPAYISGKGCWCLFQVSTCMNNYSVFII